MKLRRKPRTPFPYVLKADRDKPEAEQPRFIIAPPKSGEWNQMLDDCGGGNAALYEGIKRFVVRLEQHEDAEAFGAAGTPEREAFMDELDQRVVTELGNAVAETLLSEDDRKN